MNAILILFCAVFAGSMVDALQRFPAVVLEPLGDSLCATNEEVIAEIDQNVLNILQGPIPGNDTYMCGGTGGWRRVVYFDMTNNSTTCPPNWQLEPGLPRRVCGRTTAGFGPNAHTCDSVNFTVTGGEYSRVCGQIRSYQYGETDGFQTFNTQGVTSIDRAYISGVSLTHGSPRQHIWSFVAGRNEYQRTLIDTCPCDATIVINTPSFVGNDYFCESGVNSGSVSGFHTDDPLWDGDNCISTSTCCSFNNPPYFTKDVNTTTDDLEVRICTWDTSEDTPIELIELYVQ